MRTYGGRGVQGGEWTYILIPALDGAWPLYLQRKRPRYPFNRGWVGLRASLDVSEKRQFLVSAGNRATSPRRSSSESSSGSGDMPALFPSALDTVECLCKLHQELCHQTAPGTYWVRVWMSPTAMAQRKVFSAFLCPVHCVCWPCRIWDTICPWGIHSNDFGSINANLRTALAMTSVRPVAYWGYSHDNFSS